MNYIQLIDLKTVPRSVKTNVVGEIIFKGWERRRRHISLLMIYRFPIFCFVFIEFYSRSGKKIDLQPRWNGAWAKVNHDQLTKYSSLNNKITVKRFSKQHSVDKPLTTKYYNSRFGRHSSSSSNIGKPPGYKNNFRATDGDIPCTKDISTSTQRGGKSSN